MSGEEGTISEKDISARLRDGIDRIAKATGVRPTKIAANPEMLKQLEPAMKEHGLTGQRFVFENRRPQRY